MTDNIPVAFFSYSRSDSEFVLKLGQDLKAAATTVWLDQLDIDPGRRWDDAIQDALSRCQRMLVVLSPASVESTNVMDEVSYALEEKKLVIPVLYRDCTIPFRLRRVQHIDFRSDYQSGLNHLLTVLRAAESQGPVETLPKATAVAAGAAPSGLPQEREEAGHLEPSEAPRPSAQSSEDTSQLREDHKGGIWSSPKKFWLIAAVAIIGLGAWGVSHFNFSKPADTAPSTEAAPGTLPNVPRGPRSLAGIWVNENASPNITRMEVEHKGDEVTVHAWAKCNPSDCDWGTAKGLASGKSVSITWNQGPVSRTCTMQREAARLHVVEDSDYRDGRRPQHLEEFFVKSQ